MIEDARRVDQQQAVAGGRLVKLWWREKQKSVFTGAGVGCLNEFRTGSISPGTAGASKKASQIRKS